MFIFSAHYTLKQLAQRSAVSLSGYTHHIYIYLYCITSFHLFFQSHYVNKMVLSAWARALARALPSHSNRFSDLVEIADDLIAHVIESEQLHYFLLVCVLRARIENDGNSEREGKEKIH